MRSTRWTAICLLGLTGCATSHPIQAWQKQLTDYTMKQGNGDPNVLRESAEMRSTQSLRPAQIRFDRDPVAAGGLFADRRDVRGVMVGQHVHQGNPTFFFLVGVVDRTNVGGGVKTEDIRLVACSVRNGTHDWRISEPDPLALRKYLAHREGRTEGRAFSNSLGFPAVDDDFQFEVHGNEALARESRSDAAWRLTLN